MQVSGRCVQYRCGDAGGPHGRCPAWGAERHDYTAPLPGARFRPIFGNSGKSMYDLKFSTWDIKALQADN